MDWQELTDRQRRAARYLVRRAALKAVFGRPWSPACINVPAAIGMPDDEIRAVWRASVRRATHLRAVLGGES